jgi:hypothetical protein
VRWRGLDSSGSGYLSEAGSGKHGNKTSNLVKRVEFLDKLNNYYVAVNTMQVSSRESSPGDARRCSIQVMENSTGLTLKRVAISTILLA